MKISVILVAYYSDAWLSNCCNTLQNVSKNRLHLVLIDNTGNNIIDDIDFSNFDLELIRTPNPLGFAEANNFALVHAQKLGNYIVFLNQDTISHRDWIDECLTCFNKIPELGIVSPFIQNYDNTGWDPTFLNCLPEGDTPEAYSASFMLPVSYLPAPAMIIRKDVLLQTGPFDPVFGSYYEDFDLCHRVRKAGYQVAFCPTGIIRHFSGSVTTTREKEMRRMQQIVRNRLIFRLRTSARPRWRTFLLFFVKEMPYRLLRGMLKSSSSQPVSILLKASVDILRLARRLLSIKNDESAWHNYLQQINWEAVRAKSAYSNNFLKDMNELDV